ncbi:MAG: hypothetical protein HY670_05880 [Chloroflexi bacterium]|nr:hypothetical protein [Chloroflexota bacterium]
MTGQKVLRITGILFLLVLSISVMPAAVSGVTGVEVKAAVPATVPPDSDFTVAININQVEGFDAANYDVSFDKNVLRLDGVAKGRIGTTDIPVEWNDLGYVNKAVIRVVHNVLGLNGVTGSGYLAVLKFHAIGPAGSSTTIAFPFPSEKPPDRALSSILGEEIPVAAWTGGTVSVVVSGGTGLPPITFPPPVTASPTTPPPTTSPPPTQAPIPTPTPTPSIVDAGGIYTEKATTRSADTKLAVNIDKGTKALTRDKKPVAEVTAAAAQAPASPPRGFGGVGLTYNLGPDGATFEPPLKLTFTYDPAGLPEGAAEAGMVIAWWDTSINEWVPLGDSRVDTATMTVTATASHFTAFTVLAPVPPPPAPIFAIGNLTVNPATVKPGEVVTIMVTVINSGNAGGSYGVTLNLAGVQKTQSIELAAGASQQVSFTATKEEAGTYPFSVNELTGTLTVAVPPPAPTPTPAPSPAPSPASTPGPSQTPAPSPTPTSSPSVTLTPAPSPSPTPAPVLSVTAVPSPSPTVLPPQPLATAVITPSPTPTPSQAPVETPLLPAEPVKGKDTWLWGLIIGIVVVAGSVAGFLGVRRSKVTRWRGQ